MLNSGVAAEAWVQDAIERERASLERNRKHFVREPTEERLHAVRTTGRRLRSLLEDVASISERARLARTAKRAARYTDEARDAAVLSALLERSIDETERDAAADLLKTLQKRERRATRYARKALRRMRFEAR